MRKYFTVRELRNTLDALTALGMGDRAVSFSIAEHEDGYLGDYILVGEVSTKDALETAIYLLPLSAEDDSAEWIKIEEEGNRRLDEEEDLIDEDG